MATTGSAAIQAAIDAIDAKLADLETAGALTPNATGGEQIDHAEYFERLVSKRERLMQLLPMADGLWENLS